MNDDDKPVTSVGTPPAAEGAERDLDRMLDLLTPPAPSETLRARLLRDFAPGGSHAGAGQGAGAGGAFARARFGAVAVAAALVLAVALGITVPPGGAPAPVAPSAPASSVATATPDDAADDLFAAYEDGEESLNGESGATAAERAFAEGAPDGTAFMLAVLDLGLSANDPASDDTGSFEGMPLE